MWIVEVVSCQLLDWGVCVVLSEASEPLCFSQDAAGVGVTAILCQHETQIFIPVWHLQPSLLLATINNLLPG